MFDRLVDISSIASALVILMLAIGQRSRRQEMPNRSRLFIGLGAFLLLGFSGLHALNHAVPGSVSGLVGDTVVDALLHRGGGVLAAYLLITFGLILALPVAFADRRLRQLRTDLVHAHQEHQSVNALLSSILKSSLSGVMVLDAVRDQHRTLTDFRCRMMNSAAEQTLGRSASKLVGESLFENLPCLERSKLFNEMISVITTGLPFKDEWQSESSADRRWYQVAAVKFGDGVAVTFADISDRKAGEGRTSARFGS